MSTVIYVTDFGILLKVTVSDESGNAVDLSSYTTKILNLVSPAGVATALTADWTTDGTDGKVQATITTGILDESGTWYCQPEFQKTGAQITASKIALDAFIKIEDQ